VSHLRNRELVYLVDCNARGQLGLPLERAVP
jgi:hypothetical protein